MQMMMKSMRDATNKDDLMHSQSTDMFTAMHDQQVAQNIAGSGQLGFADMIVRQSGGEIDSPLVSTPGSGPLNLPGLSSSVRSATGPLAPSASVSFGKVAQGLNPLFLVCCVQHRSPPGRAGFIRN